ncbi:MAG: CRISPR system precrRNA processing endoribonuclease RAMP protein Cas6 [Elusimicrobiota bacterium]
MIGLFSVTLKALDRVDVPAHAGEAAHGLLFRLIQSEDRALASSIHSAGIKPFSLWVHGKSPSRDGAVLKRGESLRLTVGTLSAPLTRCLSTSLAVHMAEKKGVLLGRGRLEIAAVLPTGRKAPGLYRVSDYSDPSLLAPARSVYRLDFRTPTAFKMGDAYYPFCDPGLVLSSLNRRWNAFSPDQLPELTADDWRRALRLVRFRGRTKLFRLKAGEIPGFVGCAWISLADASKKDSARRLLGLASAAGVGIKTGMGMGQVRVFAGEGTDRNPEKGL